MNRLVLSLCLGLLSVSCGVTSNGSKLKDEDMAVKKTLVADTNPFSLQGQLFNTLYRYSQSVAGQAVTKLAVEANSVTVKDEEQSVSCEMSAALDAQAYSCKFKLITEEIDWSAEADSLPGILYLAIQAAQPSTATDVVGLTDEFGNGIACFKQNLGYACRVMLNTAVDTPEEG